MLAWIDLETTGLIASEHAILEVAAIVTNDQLQEIARFHRVVHWPQAQQLAHLSLNSPHPYAIFEYTEPRTILGGATRGGDQSKHHQTSQHAPEATRPFRVKQPDQGALREQCSWKSPATAGRYSRHCHKIQQRHDVKQTRYRHNAPRPRGVTTSNAALSQDPAVT